MEYKLEDKVWVKPTDTGDLEGVIVGFQKLEPYKPIVEVEYMGEKTTLVLDFERINHYDDGKVKPVYIRVI